MDGPFIYKPSAWPIYGCGKYISNLKIKYERFNVCQDVRYSSSENMFWFRMDFNV